MNRRFRVVLDWSNGPHEVNYASLLQSSPAAAPEGEVEQLVEKDERSDGASGSSKGSCYDDADSFIDDTELEEQFKHKRPSEKRHFRVGGLSDEETNLLPPQPPPKKKRLKQGKPTNVEDPEFKLALTQLQEQVGTRKRYGADLDPLLLNCATAARAAHPEQRFEADAQEVLYELLPFSSAKAIAQKVRKLEHDAKLQGLHTVVQELIPQLEFAIGQCIAQAEAELARAAAEPAPQVIVLGDNTFVVTAAPTNHSPELLGPVVPTSAPVAVPEGAPPVAAAEAPEEPTAVSKPRFPWNSTVEGPWFKIVSAELQLLEMNTLSSQKKANAEKKPIDADKQRQKDEQDMYKRYTELWASESIVVVTWQDLRRAYARAQRKSAAPPKTAPKPRTAPKPKLDGASKATAAATAAPSKKSPAVVEPAKRVLDDSNVANGRSPKRPSVGELRSVGPAPLMSSVFGACPQEFLQKWNAGVRAMPEIAVAEPETGGDAEVGHAGEPVDV